MSEALDKDSWMLALREGDIFEIEGLLVGLDKDEPVVWQVLEMVDVSTIKDNDNKEFLLTAHAYYHDVLIARGQVTIGVGAVPRWSIK
jgi:hypothetical protein